MCAITQASDREIGLILLEKSLYGRTDPSESSGENCELEDFINSLYALRSFYNTLPSFSFDEKSLNWIYGLQNCYYRIKVRTNRISAALDFTRKNKRAAEVTGTNGTEFVELRLKV